MKLFKRIALLSVGAAMAIGFGVAAINANTTSTVVSADGEKITDYTKVTNGKYYIGATISDTDWYLTVAGNGAETGTKKGTAVDDITTAQVFDIAVSGTSFTIKFDGTANYLSLPSGKSNGDVAVSDTATTMTASNDGGLLRLSVGDYFLQKNSGTSTNFGSYKNTQTNIFLQAASTPKTVTGITASLKDSTKTYYAGDTLTIDDINVTINYDDESTRVISDGTGVTITSGANLAQGSNTIGVTCVYNETEYNTTLAVTAQASRYILSYALTGDMEKKSYVVGEPWNFSGIKISAIYNVGDPEVVADLNDVIADNTKVNEYILSVTEPAIGVTSLRIYDVVVYGGTDCDEITINDISVVGASLNAEYDLTTNTQVTSATEDALVFASGSTTVTFAKGTSTTKANNYYGGDASSHTSTRGYNGGIMTIDAGVGYTITTVEITCSTDNYATALKNATIANGTAAAGSSTKDVVITAESGKQTVEVTFGATVGMSTIVVNRQTAGGPAISITGAPVGDLLTSATGTLGYETSNATNPVVTWTSSDSSIVSINASTGAWEAHKIGEVTITASLTCTEGNASTTTRININVGGHISISEAVAISTEIGSGKQTAYTVEVTGYITSLDTDGKTRALRIDEAKAGSDTNIIIYGIYSDNNLRNYAIVGGKLTVRGIIKNFSGTHELDSVSVVSYEDDAIKFAHDSFAALNEACVNGPAAITEAQWQSLTAAFNALTEAEQAKLRAATSEYAHNDDVRNWVARYDRCVAYGLADFMGSHTGSNAVTLFSNNTLAIIVAISAISLLAVAVILRRKQLVK